jgi:site-specific DNA-cytosine methylase
MKILIACEESQAVTIEFRKLGIEAWSCDILECSGGHPEWHIQGDVLEQLNKGWDAMIAFPPCTHLAVSGARWFPEKRKDGRQQQAVEFFMRIINAPIKHIAVENPVGIMSSMYRKPNQIIQPYYFGDTERKTTCLWLKNLPLLKPTNIVAPIFSKSGYSKTHLGYGKKNSTMRSKTFPGIAKAIATQWSEFLTKNVK